MNVGSPCVLSWPIERNRVSALAKFVAVSYIYCDTSFVAAVDTSTRVLL